MALLQKNKGEGIWMMVTMIHGKYIQEVSFRLNIDMVYAIEISTWYNLEEYYEEWYMDNFYLYEDNYFHFSFLTTLLHMVWPWLKEFNISLWLPILVWSFFNGSVPSKYTTTILCWCRRPFSYRWRDSLLVERYLDPYDHNEHLMLKY